MSTKVLFIVTLLGFTIVPQLAIPACFYNSEVISGLNKICYYDCISGTRAITIDATDLCPLSFPED